MSTLVKSLNNKYSDDEDDQENSFGFIVFISCSPETKRGLLPNIITLNEYNIERVGDFSGLSLQHISELDLTDNLISEWSEVVNILSAFPRLTFLNLSNNLLRKPLELNTTKHSKYNMKKLVLNGNRLSWETVLRLTNLLGSLEELHVSANCLEDPSGIIFKHDRLKFLYLSCNPLSDFDLITRNLIYHCPRLQFLSLSECPVHTIPELQGKVANLQSLNVSTTALNSWTQVDKLRNYPALSDLRIQGCKFLGEYTAYERRMMLIARLPNIKVLNGGDTISKLEREDAERAFIRYFLDTPEDERPSRFQELVEVHGLLDPLVNIDLTPEVNILVKIHHGESCREERISVRQTVKNFKLCIQSMFSIAPSNMRLYYYDQEMSKITGPEEMKWGSKGLYTYNVRQGDYFVVDQKNNLTRLKSTRSNPLMFGSPSPKGYTSLSAKTGSKLSFGERTPNQRRNSSGSKSGSSCTPPERSSVSRNIFSSNNYGEFHHSKVFPESHEQNTRPV